MSDITKYIGNSEYWYAPVGVFALFMIIAALIGAWNGWKTALYFLGWNVVALIATVPFMDKIVYLINGKAGVSNLFDNLKGMDFSDFIHRYAVPVILFDVLLVSNLLAFIFYWFFRKKLKKQIKENKKLGRSNAAARWGGVAVGMLTALPMTVFLTEEVSLVSSNNGFTTFNGSLTKFLTGGKVTPYDEADAHGKDGKDHLKDILNSVEDAEAIKILANSLGGKNGAAITQDSLDKASTLINNPVILGMITPEFVKSQIGTSNPTPPSQDLTNKIKLNSENKAKIESILGAVFGSPLTQAQFDHIFTVV